MRVPHAHGEVSHFMRMIRRDEFDAWLAGKAAGRGIEIREGVTVRSVVPDGSGVIVETDRGRFLAEVVVGADGSKGVTRRCVLPTERTHTARALEIITSYAALAEAGKTEDRQVQGQRSAQKAGHAYFDFFAVPKGIAGYVWDFPTQVRGEPRRCWGIYDANLLRQSRRPPLKEPLREEMARAGLDVESYPLQGHPIRWFSPGRAVAVARVVLVGDAAGVDGVFGEGISMALGYGQVAAHAIQDAWRRGDFSFRDYHRRLLLSPLGISLTTRWAVTHVVYRVRWAWFQHLVWRVLRGPVAAGARLLILNWAGRMSGTGTLGGSRRR
jgi:flavin-dependent dehydrogenase